MYERYWQLEQPPFENHADTNFYYPARTHQGALLKLRYLIENRKGLGLLAGGHGIGKTFITRVLESELEETYTPFVRLVYPLLEPEELLGYLALRLDEESPEAVSNSQDTVLRRLERRLEQFTYDNRHPVIVIDDAHLLEPRHLQVLQLLTNVQQDLGNRFSIILTGQPELLPHVERLAGLSSRVAVRITLRPLPAEETADYVKHRLFAAGARGPVFSEDSLQTFWELSRGIPRRINQVGDLSLLVGYADGLQTVSPVEIEAAAEELTCVSTD